MDTAAVTLVTIAHLRTFPDVLMADGIGHGIMLVDGATLAGGIGTHGQLPTAPIQRSADRAV